MLSVMYFVWDEVFIILFDFFMLCFLLLNFLKVDKFIIPKHLLNKINK